MYVCMNECIYVRIMYVYTNVCMLVCICIFVYECSNVYM